MFKRKENQMQKPSTLGMNLACLRKTETSSRRGRVETVVREEIGAVQLGSPIIGSLDFILSVI